MHQQGVVMFWWLMILLFVLTSWPMIGTDGNRMCWHWKVAHGGPVLSSRCAFLDSGPCGLRGECQHTLAITFFPTICMFRSQSLPTIAVLPQAPQNGSPVPWLTSLYHKANRGNYGSAAYPGNCSGELIKDLIRYFKPKNVLDPMTGSSTCLDVCRELKIQCRSSDISAGVDACDPKTYEDLGTFDFVWLHPPYWRQKQYTDDLRDMCNAPTLQHFLYRYEKLIGNCASVLNPGGKLAILMGDYSDREAGFCPLVYHTKRLCFEAGLKQKVTDIIRFSHGASSSKKVYKSSFIPGLHDVCLVVEKEA